MHAASGSLKRTGTFVLSTKLRFNFFNTALFTCTRRSDTPPASTRVEHYWRAVQIRSRKLYFFPRVYAETVQVVGYCLYSLLRRWHPQPKIETIFFYFHRYKCTCLHPLLCHPCQHHCSLSRISVWACSTFENVSKNKITRITF